MRRWNWEIHNAFVRQIIGVAFVGVLLVISAKAVRELVEIDEPQPAQRIEGIVLDPSGAPIEGLTVTDRSEQWSDILRSTTTDIRGRFRFSPQPGKTLYYLRFDHALFNPLQLKLKLDKKSRNRAITVKVPIGG